MLKDNVIVYEKGFYRIVSTPDGHFVEAKDDELNEWLQITNCGLAMERAVLLVESNLKQIRGEW